MQVLHAGQIVGLLWIIKIQVANLDSHSEVCIEATSRLTDSILITCLYSCYSTAVANV